jgi:hypothetical protein
MGRNPITGTDTKPETDNADEMAFALSQARQAKTALGRRLWEIRARVVASGLPLLSWDEIDLEVAKRRGGYSHDE